MDNNEIKTVQNKDDNKKENKPILFAEILKRFALIMVSTFGITVACGFVMDKLEALINAGLASKFGVYAILITAVVGTPVHELSHLFFCIIFRFPVKDIALLRPVAFQTDGVLGYVKYVASNGNLFWTAIGKFFVGFGPMILGTAVIMLITRLLVPEISQCIKSKVSALGKEDASRPGKMLGATFTGFWKGLFSVRKWGILRAVICIYISISISSHMTLSYADLQGTSLGIAIISGLIFIYSVVSALLKAEYAKTVGKIAISILFYYLIAIFLDLILLVVSRVGIW